MLVRNTSERVIHLNTKEGNVMIVPGDAKDVVIVEKNKIIAAMLKDGLIRKETAPKKEAEKKGK